METHKQGDLGEVTRLFLKLGCIAFGGPAAHIAMMHDEVVKRRQWVTEQEFLDLLGATNLIPGPNSTEMAIHLGLRRAGWRGLLIAGTCFIVPAMLIVLAFAWAYVRFGSTPQATWLLYGIIPVIIAVVFQALWTLARQAVKGVTLGILGGGVFVLYLGGVGEIPLMFGTGVLAMLLANVKRLYGSTFMLAPLPLTAMAQNVSLPALAVPSGLLTLFLVFLKVGAVLSSIPSQLAWRWWQLCCCCATKLTPRGWYWEEVLLPSSTTCCEDERFRELQTSSMIGQGKAGENQVACGHVR